MLNKCVLIGRLCARPELRYTTAGHAVATFTLAVDRPFKDNNGEKATDFIKICCWRKLAEIVANNLDKGRLVATSGSIQVRSYEATDGSKRQATEIVAEDVRFLDFAKDGQRQEPAPTEEDPF